MVVATTMTRGMSFATFRRFWAVAANRNSSLAPLGPIGEVKVRGEARDVGPPPRLVCAMAPW
jgi:hypothetical protein